MDKITSFPQRKPYVVGRHSQNEVNRSWLLKLESKEVKIHLRHNVFSLLRVVYLDGEEVARESSHGPIDRPNDTTLTFPVGEASAVITIRQKTSSSSSGMKVQESYEYTCEVEDATVELLANCLDKPSDQQPFHITIPSTSSSTICEDGKKTILYTIHAKRNEISTVVQRRYSEFVRLNDIIRSYFKGSHLLSSLPHLPSKGFRWPSQQSKGFIEHRRSALEVYLSRLAGFPRAADSFEFLVFLDLDPISSLPSEDQLQWQQENSTKEHVNEESVTLDIPKGFSSQEIQVVFTEVGPLGLDISPLDPNQLIGPLIVTDVKSCGVSPENYRLALENICRGYAICRMSKQCTLDWTVNQLTEFAKTTSRPLVVHFLRPLEDSTPNAVSPEDSNNDMNFFPRLR